jgi:hypothetical protein
MTDTAACPVPDRIQQTQDEAKEDFARMLSVFLEKHLSPGTMRAFRNPKFLERFDLEMEVALLRIELLAAKES